MPVDAVLIAGPTASGKSAAALALAEKLGGAIINADSMQVYRELRILTARPTPEDEAARAAFSLRPCPRRRSATPPAAIRMKRRTRLRDARERGLLPIFVGGTGLYFSVLTEGLSPIPAVPAEVRTLNRQRFETLGRDAFFADLASATMRRPPRSSGPATRSACCARPMCWRRPAVP